MVIVLKKEITSEEKNQIRNFLATKNFKLNEVDGEEKSIIAAVGRLAIDPHDVEILGGVESVIPISKPYKMASREFKKENTIIEIKNNLGQSIRCGGQRIISIAGPCAVENELQMMTIAKAVKQSGACMLRGGAYKPRSSPYSFQGLGEEGLILLKKAGDSVGLPVVTEVVSSEHLPLMEKHGVDVYQIGARNMQNFELLKALGKLNKPVILKRGLSATIEEWLMSAEYLLSSGTDKVILCERGIRTYEKATRNTLDLSAVPVLRSMTHLPIIVDPSHALGIRDKIPPMALASIAAGADGIIVEVHNEPAKALSDGPQQLLPEQFDTLMQNIESLAPVLRKSVVHVRSDISLNSSASGKNAVSSKTAETDSKITCAYSGNKGAYAEQAAGIYFDGQAEAVPEKSFRSVFEAVQDGRATYGIIPIENALAGSIYDNYDNLASFEDVSIVGALNIKIQHALLAPRGTKISDIKNVYSHPQGFAQCSDFLYNHKDWKKIDAVSTATAAKLISEENSKENAAIASALNAKYYNLDIIQDAIQDDARDYTRFLVIAGNQLKNHASSGQNPNMTSLIFSVVNEPGALCKCLQVFTEAGLNLTRLESRPIKGEPWKYWFYADVELKNGQDEKDVGELLEKIRPCTNEARVLGTYFQAKRDI